MAFGIHIRKCQSFTNMATEGRNICSRDWRRHTIVTHCSRKIDGDNIDKQVQMNLYATPRQNGLWINYCYRYIFLEFTVSLVCFTFIHWFVFYLFIFSNYRCDFQFTLKRPALLYDYDNYFKDVAVGHIRANPDCFTGLCNRFGTCLSKRVSRCDVRRQREFPHLVRACSRKKNRQSLHQCIEIATFYVLYFILLDKDADEYESRVVLEKANRKFSHTRNLQELAHDVVTKLPFRQLQDEYLAELCKITFVGSHEQQVHRGESHCIHCECNITPITPINSECPVCLVGALDFIGQCGHGVCNNCMTGLRSFALGQVTCPMCRQPYKAAQ